MSSKQQLAETAVQALWNQDNASKALGMRIISIAPGEAKVEMTVRDDMTNGHHICHGGFVFALADSAFAFACNSHGQDALAQHCSISYIKPAKRGMVLTAHASECHSGARSGITDVSVRDETNDLVAAFRGHSRVVTKKALPHA